MGGNIAQIVAIIYNVPATVVFNSAPVYLGNIDILDTMKLFGAFELLNKIKNEIHALNFTGTITGYRAEGDILNAIAERLSGRYLGTEYKLKDAGLHMLGGITDNPRVMKEMERLNPYTSMKLDVDIDGDGKADLVNKGIADLRMVNLLSLNEDEKYLPVIRGNCPGSIIRINKEALDKLSSNIRT